MILCSLQAALRGERVGNLKVIKLEVWKQAVRIHLKQETSKRTHIIDILPQIKGKGTRPEACKGDIVTLHLEILIMMLQKVKFMYLHLREAQAVYLLLEFEALLALFHVI